VKKQLDVTSSEKDSDKREKNVYDDREDDDPEMKNAFLVTILDNTENYCTAVQVSVKIT
jgi:hypothetical protein